MQHNRLSVDEMLECERLADRELEQLTQRSTARTGNNQMPSVVETRFNQDNPLSQTERAAVRAQRPGPREIPLCVGNCR